ncbi:MAG: alpha/beta hydrolase [Gemmatimonadetes bacterium]|nr:alpha/beta hydrolase [Gemmatimonadota bacterium]
MMTQWLDYGTVHGSRHTVRGTVKVLREVPSPQLDNRRDLLVYLPPDYETSDQRYPVVYMHDGQNLFDHATSFSGEWAVDKTMDEASRDGLGVIIVGIPNMGAERIDEYSPFADERMGGGRGDTYIAFITDTLKPLIDRSFRTHPGVRHTGVAGSSMGGLISLHALLTRPDVFGFAAAMSPSLWFARRAIFDRVAAISAAVGRLYLDVGTAEHPGAVADVRRLRRMLRRAGYRRANLRFVIDRGGRHHESAWGRRLRAALEFLLEPLRE